MQKVNLVMFQFRSHSYMLLHNFSELIIRFSLYFIRVFVFIFRTVLSVTYRCANIFFTLYGFVQYDTHKGGPITFLNVNGICVNKICIKM